MTIGESLELSVLKIRKQVLEMKIYLTNEVKDINALDIVNVNIEYIETKDKPRCKKCWTVLGEGDCEDCHYEKYPDTCFDCGEKIGTNDDCFTCRDEARDREEMRRCDNA